MFWDQTTIVERKYMTTHKSFYVSFRFIFIRVRIRILILISIIPTSSFITDPCFSGIFCILANPPHFLTHKISHHYCTIIIEYIYFVNMIFLCYIFHIYLNNYLKYFLVILNNKFRVAINNGD